jgi:hypothetical protein
MKRKTLDKMTLHRESLRRLEQNALREVAGGITSPPVLTCVHCTHAPITC